MGDQDIIQLQHAFNTKSIHYLKCLQTEVIPILDFIFWNTCVYTRRYLGNGTQV